MKVSGFTFIRNAIKNDYPIVEAITSVLPICDEFIVACGRSDDETLALIKNIGSDKIRILETIWDDTLREGGRTFALETDKAYNAIAPDTDWAFYIQGDEVIHEKYLPILKQNMENYLHEPNVEGLLLKYLHFYGSYDFVASSRRWYRNEIRVLKFAPGVHSYRDAQGFRKNDRKIQVKPIDAYVYHYGWVKAPQGLDNKVRNFNQFYHDDNWIAEKLPINLEFDYTNADRLLKFDGIHPQVMQKRIKALNWEFNFDPTKQEINKSNKRKFLQWFEDKTGIRLFEYCNYKIVK